jgi:RNA polymerase sigma-70 factor (ECF subfamily)
VASEPSRPAEADLGALYRTWWPVAVDFAARKLGNLEEAEAIAQEALLRALDVARREEVRSFSALVLRITHHLVVDRVRLAEWRSARTSPDDVPTRQEVDPVELGRIRAAVDQLPDDLREVVELKYVDGRSFAEIAGDLGLSKNGVFARHQRALDALRALFDPRRRSG